VRSVATGGNPRRRSSAISSPIRRPCFAGLVSASRLQLGSQRKDDLHQYRPRNGAPKNGLHRKKGPVSQERMLTGPRRGLNYESRPSSSPGACCYRPGLALRTLVVQLLPAASCRSATCSIFFLVELSCALRMPARCRRAMTLSFLGRLSMACGVVFSAGYGGATSATRAVPASDRSGTLFPSATRHACRLRKLAEGPADLRRDVGFIGLTHDVRTDDRVSRAGSSSAIGFAEQNWA